ncbi:hypothetical protein IJF85_00830 [Candidatus Saccharibacteria bacterium]|nr:hypothetical protein [Candidatus Saccharibacteria bacterium]MBQ3264067.1 hypothetical protein [Candidatus Saccharibacteria bacterium]
MNFIHVLVIAVSVLTVLSAVALLFGSSKSEKGRSLWFLTAAIGEAVWGLSISLFLSIDSGNVAEAVAPFFVRGIYAGAVLMDVALLGYIAWKYKLGKIATILFAIIGVGLVAILFYDPAVLYSAIVLGKGGPSIEIDLSHGFYIAYALFFCTITPAFCGFLIHQIKNARNKNVKKGYLFFLAGLSVAGILSLIFDIILPPMRYDLIWVGPLTIGLVILGFYYAILRFRMVTISTGWLKVMSYAVILSSAFVVYLLIFHLVFSALFKVASPSYQVILLNFIMVAIVLCLTPAISEIATMSKSFILTKQIDIAYIVKKLTGLNRKKLSLKEVSGFLAEYMHFDYVGFLINGRYYVEDDDYKLPAEALGEIAKLKRPERGVWQDTAVLPKEMKTEYGVMRVAILTNTNGDEIGQVVLGKPSAKANLDKKDLAEVEMIISLMGTLVENDGRKS